jgi:Plasmid pRiA4b ORF-3-like protein
MRTHALELDSTGRTPMHGSMTDQIARIRITLEDIKPAVWRRVELPITNSLKTLHLAIQACMLFENYHLFRFDVGDAAYGIRFDDDDAFMIRTRDASNMRIGKLVERDITGFTYTYDFGDNWRHRIEIEAVLPAIPGANYPRFVDGERRAPPEDVGGTPGFEEFLNAMADPRHPARASMIEWYGGLFDSADISADEISARMAKLTKRRAQGKAAYADAKSRNS